MPQHSVTSDYFSGQGIVMVATKATLDGEPEGFVPVGNVTDLAIDTEITKNEHKESMTGQRSVDKVLATETNVTFSMTMESVNQENLAYALRGAVTAVTGGSQAATSYTAKLGKIVPLGFIDVTSVVVQDVTDVTTYVAGDNYRLDEAAGSLYIMTAAEQTAAAAANSIAEDDVLHIAFDYADQKVMDAMTQPAQVRWVRFEGLNTADDNAPVVVDLFKMEADLLNQLALISDELNNMEITGTVLSDETRLTGSKHFKVTSRK